VKAIKETDFIISLIYQLLPQYINSNTVEYHEIVGNIVSNFFSIFVKTNQNEQGLTLFHQIQRSFDANVFDSSKAYSVYFAYQLRDYSSVEHLLNRFFIEFTSDSYQRSYDFCMFNYYKGLIFLSQEELYKASACFLACFKVTAQSNVYNHFHVDAIKRLYLLSHIVEPIYKNAITSLINQHKKLVTIKPVEPYAEFSSFIKTKQTSYKELDKIVKDNIAKFKSDKTNGLVKLVLKDFALQKIVEGIKPYKRIKIEYLIY
jgi:hypothetical protein